MHKAQEGFAVIGIAVILSMRQLFFILSINLVMVFQVFGQTVKHVSKEHAIVPEEKLRIVLNVDTILVNAPEGIFFVITSYEDGAEKYRIVCEKNKFSMWKGSSRQIIEGEQAMRIYEQSFLLIEPAYLMLGIRPELLGIEKVEGRYAYKVRTVFGSINICSYYDCQHGLKVKVDVEMRNNHKISFVEDYRKTDIGLLYAYTLRRLDGISTIARIEINQGLKLEDFQ